MKRLTNFIAIVFLALASINVWAAKDPNGPGAAPVACEGLRVATGPSGKGYSKLFKDMVKVSEGKLALCEVNTEGGLDNLTTLSTKGADVAIVPLDALKTMAAGDENIAGLLAVAPLNSNFLHVLVNNNGFTVEGPKKLGGMMKGDPIQVYISKVSQLRGQRVALVGSAQLLVRQLDKQLGFGMQMFDVSEDAKAIDMVKKGQVAAALTVAGWPAGPVKSLKQEDGIGMAQFDVSIGGAYSVRPFTYKNIGVYNVQALSIQNVLVTRPFAATKMSQVATLKRILSDRLTDLKDGDFEPGWNEIKSIDGKVDWNMMPTAAPSKK